MKYVFVVLTNPVEGQEDEYNEWYNDQHLADVLKVPGFVAAQRFKLADTSPPQEFAQRYLAIYEVESDDLDLARHALSSRANTPDMEISAAFSRNSTLARYFQPITERLTHDE